MTLAKNKVLAGWLHENWCLVGGVTFVVEGMKICVSLQKRLGIYLDEKLNFIILRKKWQKQWKE